MIPIDALKRLVIVGATAMVGSYALDHPPSAVSPQFGLSKEH